MQDVAVALIWHQHQPYYPDDVGKENPMPWVRLHGTKDYWGMAMLLKETPEMHATINLVPSLLVQLLGYTEGGHVDEHLRVSHLPADGLSENDLLFLMDNFFMVHPDHNIRPYARYHELYKKRGLGVDSAEHAHKRFNKKDIIDLQCWSNLAWIHPIAFELDADLAEFRKKGRHWTEKEKTWLLDKQMAMLKEIIPLHRELQQRGQLELTTTPFYHPILPLLWDKRQARRAMPDVVLPKNLEGYPEDGKEHLRRAVEFHEKIFGMKPRGMWPSEGSVSQMIVPAIADAGIQWIATDEEILSCSTDGWVSRDPNGFLRNPEMLYRPWRVEEQGKNLQIIFRDHAMSDQVGFIYQRFTAEHAVNDFTGKLEAIGKATTSNAGHRPTLVSIILDGENCWEYYPNAGLDFLRGLYRRLSHHPKIKPVRVSDYLAKHPATDKIGHLFPGSWIQHNFGIWIGHSECNQAWDDVFETRKKLVEATARKEIKPEKLSRAWEELYIAEGSDWYWWFGDSHSCAQQGLFDRLFRKHLQNVYTLLDLPAPAELSRPIHQGYRPAAPYVEPKGLLQVKVNGKKTYFEWINAGHFVSGGSRGTMNMVTAGLISDLRFGFDPERLLIRLDTKNGPVREQLAEIDAIRINLLAPAGFQLIVKKPFQKQPAIQLTHNDVTVASSGATAAADTIFEMAVPFRSLAVTTDEHIQFFVELIRNKQPIERIPHEGAIETSVPSRDYELMMWQA